MCVRFFFSSRRRHTRFSRDWSSDVCSSDLQVFQSAATLRRKLETCELERKTYAEAAQKASQTVGQMQEQLVQSQKLAMLGQVAEIGRASCRERVESRVGLGCWKTKK